MKKRLIMCLTLIFTMLLGGCGSSAVMKEMRVYPVESEVRSLKIQIGAADFTIVESDAVSVESNLKYLSVTEKGGVLSVIDKAKKSAEYEDSVLVLYLPTDRVYESVEITTGAGRLTADTLHTKVLELKLGAGQTEISNLIVESEADIRGGVGEIKIADGQIRDLDLEMGVGELNLTSTLLGDAKLTFGVGESDLTLLGSEDDYRIDLKKGIGGITMDGKSVSGSGKFGNGQNSVEMHGGIGAIHLQFR